MLTSESPLRLPQIVQREKPDLVLLDVEMPALTGEHVLDLTKMFDFLRTTPIVLISSKSDAELQALVDRSNAIGYIRKSPNALGFVTQVQKFLASSTSVNPNSPDSATNMTLSFAPIAPLARPSWAE